MKNSLQRSYLCTLNQIKLKNVHNEKLINYNNKIFFRNEQYYELTYCCTFSNTIILKYRNNIIIP